MAARHKKAPSADKKAEDGDTIRIFTFFAILVAVALVALIMAEVFNHKTNASSYPANADGGATVGSSPLPNSPAEHTNAPAAPAAENNNTPATSPNTNANSAAPAPTNNSTAAAPTNSPTPIATPSGNISAPSPASTGNNTVTPSPAPTSGQ